MTVKLLHMAALPNDHNTIYRIFVASDLSRPAYKGKFTTMPPHIRKALVISFDYTDDDAFIVYVKLNSCPASSCVW